jgi:alkylation response protein AidB-like acyl-CoA dehydrogenase
MSHGLRAGSARPSAISSLAFALGICAACGMARARGRPLADGILDENQVQLAVEMELTEALRVRLRVAAEGNRKSGGYANNAIFLQNFAADVIQRVTALNLEIHGGEGVVEMNAGADKLVRDAVMWTHLAGDSVQRMKAVRKH